VSTQRILRSVGSTIEVKFYKDGNLIDADGAVTVTIDRADGTNLTTGAATTKPAGTTGTYQYALAAQANLDVLTAKWTGTFGGVSSTVMTHVEIVGRHLWTEAEARAFDNGALADATKYPDADIARERDRITNFIQHRTNVAWVPRYARVKLDGSGSDEIVLPHTVVNKLIAVTIDGVSVATAKFDPDEDGLLIYTDGTFPVGRRNVIVAYEHGHEQDVDGVGYIGLRILRNTLVPTNISDRVRGFNDDSGNQFVVFPTAGNPLGIPEADAWLRNHIMPGTA
jgi:hypothetical protein